MLFLKACVLGCMVAIPVGPVGLLVMQRSLTIGTLAGLSTGLGAALADGVFGFLAAFGLVTLVGELDVGRHFLRPLGSLALAIVGVYFYFHRPPKILHAEDVLTGRYQRRYWWDVISSFFLTLMNPTTIIAFAALFAGSDLVPEDPKKVVYLEVSSGIFTGSLVWWLLVTALAQPFKKRLSPHNVHRVLQVIGAILVVLALLSFIPRLGGVIDKLHSLITIYF